MGLWFSIVPGRPGIAAQKCYVVEGPKVATLQSEDGFVGVGSITQGARCVSTLSSLIVYRIRPEFCEAIIWEANVAEERSFVNRTCFARHRILRGG